MLDILPINADSNEQIVELYGAGLLDTNLWRYRRQVKGLCVDPKGTGVAEQAVYVRKQELDGQPHTVIKLSTSYYFFETYFAYIPTATELARLVYEAPRTYSTRTIGLGRNRLAPALTYTAELDPDLNLLAVTIDQTKISATNIDYDRPIN